MIETALAIATPAPSYEPLSVALAELGDDAGLVGAARPRGYCRGGFVTCTSFASNGKPEREQREVARRRPRGRAP